MMTLIANDTPVRLTAKERQERRESRERNIATLQGFLQENFQPSDRLTAWLDGQNQLQIATRDFGLLVDDGMQTSKRTIITLHKHGRCGHSLVYFRGADGNGFADLDEFGDMLSELSPDELLREHGDAVVAKIAESVTFLRQASAIMP